MKESVRKWWAVISGAVGLVKEPEQSAWASLAILLLLRGRWWIDRKLTFENVLNQLRCVQTMSFTIVVSLFLLPFETVYGIVDSNNTVQPYLSARGTLTISPPYSWICLTLTSSIVFGTWKWKLRMFKSYINIPLLRVRFTQIQFSFLHKLESAYQFTNVPQICREMMDEFCY